MKTSFVFASAILLAVASANAQTTLAVGDISLIGYRTDASDGYAWVTWVDLAPNTEIRITDNQFNEASVFLATENTAVWNNSTGSTIPAGTVIVGIDNTGTAAVDRGSITTGNLSGISASGDNLFFYQGATLDLASLKFGAILNTGWLTTGAGSSNTSYLPSTLSVANGNIVLSPIDNGQYTGSRTSNTIAAHRANIATAGVFVAANWTLNDDTAIIPTLDSTDFVIVGGGPVTATEANWSIYQ